MLSCVQHVENFTLETLALGMYVHSQLMYSTHAYWFRPIRSTRLSLILHAWHRLLLSRLPLVKRHEAAGVKMQGSPCLDRALLWRLTRYGRFADAAYDCQTVPALAAALHIQVC